MAACRKCGAAIDDVNAANCPQCGVNHPLDAEIAPIKTWSEPAKKSSGGGVWKWVIGVPVGLFVLFLVLGSMMSPEDSRKYSKRAAIDDACEKMMSDSALGNERRMTRSMCDQMKADAMK